MRYKVDMRKLYEVENYHKKLAKILDRQFSDEKKYLEQQIEELRGHVKILTDEMQSLGITGNISKEFLDRHSEIKGKINALKEQNFAYLTLTKLNDAKSKAASLLWRKIEGVLVPGRRYLYDIDAPQLCRRLLYQRRKVPRPLLLYP